jgi:hypothetical protein
VDAAFLSFGQVWVNCCVPALGPHLCSALARAPDWAPAIPSYPAIFLLGLAPLVRTAHAVRSPAAEHGVPGLAAAAPIAENPGPAAPDFSSDVLPAFLADQVPAPCIASVVDSARELHCRAAHNGNARGAA